jgi:hypothetical protein
VFRTPAVRIALLIGIAASLAVSRTLGQSPAIPATGELTLKAAVLLKIPSFVDWPAEVFEAKSSAFVVVILGDDPLGGMVEHAFKNARIGERRVVVSRVSRVDQVQTCHMMYVGDSEERRLETILTSAEQKGVLTVGSFSRFAQRGGMIHLLVENDRVTFAINNRSTRLAGLKISSKLLSLAQSVINE